MLMQNDILEENQELNECISLDDFDFDELEEKLQSKLQEEMSQLEFLEAEKEKISNPENLGKVILDEVWKEFSVQIGLDITNETLIQKYDREHPETYEEVSKRVMQDKRYTEANKQMKRKQQEGTLQDAYTGKTLKRNEKANLDHVVSRKELYENLRRKQANLSTEELANKQENLQPTNEALNKSKGAKSVDEYIEQREERERRLKEQNERANKKIDDSNMSETEKRLQKEKNNKRLQDKLDLDEERMREADRKARRAINKEIYTGVVKEVTKKAATDALKQMVVSAMFTLLKEIINSLVRFLKSQVKSFKLFLDEMKQALKSFFTKLNGILKMGVSSVIGTIVSEIFGPIVSLFKKLASLIKQGVASVMEAIRYLRDKENKNKPFSVKVAQIGKMLTAGLVSGGAIFLGEVFEKLLLSVPGMQITIPYLGSLANIIGMFLASILSGVIGAIIINLIDRFISKKLKAEIIEAKIEKGNEILGLQTTIRTLNEEKLEHHKETVFNTIKERHNEAADIIRESLINIADNCKTDESVDDDLMKLRQMLDELE